MILVEGTFLISISELVPHKTFHMPHHCEPLNYAINELIFGPISCFTSMGNTLCKARCPAATLHTAELYP